MLCRYFPASLSSVCGATHLSLLGVQRVDVVSRSSSSFSFLCAPTPPSFTTHLLFFTLLVIFLLLLHWLTTLVSTRNFLIHFIAFFFSLGSGYFLPRSASPCFSPSVISAVFSFCCFHSPFTILIFPFPLLLLVLHVLCFVMSLSTSACGACMAFLRVPLHCVFPACGCISGVVATFAAVAHAHHLGTTPPLRRLAVFSQVTCAACKRPIEAMPREKDG